MAISRLMAKGWGLFCLFALLYALAAAADAATLPRVSDVLRMAVMAALFAAMGLLFIAGYGIATGSGPLAARLVPHHLLPGFNEMVYLGFALAIFVVQAVLLPIATGPTLLDPLRAPLAFAVPGEAALNAALNACSLDDGRMLASSFAWLLAFIFLASSLSQMRLAAGILRLERKQRAEPLTAGGAAILLGGLALFFLQLIYLGVLDGEVPCRVWAGVGGDLLIGQAPLALAYLILAAFTHLVATGEQA